MFEGYDSEFLGKKYKIPLPTAGLEIKDDVLELDDLESSPIVNYLHYSVMMSKSNKQAFFSAANLDRKQAKVVTGRNWFVDRRIGAENQITNNFYKHNVWDRGHLTRRTAITWGSSDVATRASNESCSYANASMQHENFNKDEWRIVENLSEDIQTVKNKRLTILSGPLFTQTDRWYTRRATDEKIRIPTGFWKLISFVHTGMKKLVTLGFVLFQDDQAMLDRKGGRILKSNIHEYQVTTTELGLLTGLLFPKIMFDTNPLYFNRHKGFNDLPEGLGIPQHVTKKNYKKFIAFKEKETTGRVKDGQRNLSADKFDDLIYLMDH